MKKLICILLLMSLSWYGFGQVETKFSKEISAEFQQNYNSDNFQRIFELFSPEMKSALSLARATKFLKGLKTQAGKIKNRKFIGYENGTYASYKTSFERAVLSLNISLDHNSKINGLFVNSFTDSTLSKLVRNKTKLILPFHGAWTVFWGGDTKRIKLPCGKRSTKKCI